MQFCASSLRLIEHSVPIEVEIVQHAVEVLLRGAVAAGPNSAAEDAALGRIEQFDELLEPERAGVTTFGSESGLLLSEFVDGSEIRILRGQFG